MTSKADINCDLLVIGTGLAGMASALFAAQKGINTVQVGMDCEINFASGLLDLMAIHPISEQKIWEDPWEAINALEKDSPLHPYARINNNDIRQSVSDFLAFLHDNGLQYKHLENQNSQIITSLGTVKTTYCVPLSMWNGIKALNEKLPCLVIDFNRLKGFSALQIKSVMAEKWPGLKTARVPFPETNGEVFPVHAARALENPETRKKLAALILPHIKGAHMVGMPAILGVSNTMAICSDLETLLGVPIFEIPMMPPSTPGIRLKDTLEQNLATTGVHTLFQQKILDVTPLESNDFIFKVGHDSHAVSVHAKGAILASGRFFGKGLYASRTRIRESVFDLPVFQPDNRADWHHKDFFDLSGHKINTAGLEIDDSFRPLDTSGTPIFETLFAAGSILAHQDWKRMKCGSGLSIASAYAAVQSFSRIVPSEHFEGQCLKPNTQEI